MPSFWDQFQQAPTTGGITGQPSVDPGQLQQGGDRSTMPMQPRPPIAWDPNAQQIAPGDSLPYLGGGSLAAPGMPPPTGGVAGGQNTGTPMATGSGGQDPQAFFNQLFPGQTLTPQMLADQEAALKAQGITLIRNAAGQPSKIRLPDGSVIDPIIGAGSGQNAKAWNQVAGPGGAPMGGGGQGSALAGLGYSFGSSMAPWTKEFAAPTADQALATPGLQFALNEANRMGQNSAAAKGTLLNGRFQQALAGSNIQNALQGYGDVYNRGMNEYLLGRENFYNNQDRPFNKNVTLANLGAPK